MTTCGPPSREARRRGPLWHMSGPPRSSIGALGALSAVGIAFVLAVGIGFLVGYWLDRWLGTSPLFTLVFFFFGVAAGIVNVVRTVNAVDREEKR